MNEPIHITSRQNPHIRQIRALAQRKQRAEQGLFVVEGIHPIGAAVEAGALIEYLLYSPDLLTSEFAKSLVARAAEKGVRVFTTTPEIFASLADKENPQGLLAVVRQFPHPLDSLNPENFAWGVALVSPQDPGNLGTILRTIDAVGASGLLLLDHAADPYHPTAVRASMGALFWKPIVQSSFADFAAWAKSHGYHVYGSSARGDTPYADAALYRRPAILLLGSEREGLTPEQTQLCEVILRLPIEGHATSLNLAVAAGVLLYNMRGRFSTM